MSNNQTKSKSTTSTKNDTTLINYDWNEMLVYTYSYSDSSTISTESEYQNLLNNLVIDTDNIHMTKETTKCYVYKSGRVSVNIIVKESAIFVFVIDHKTNKCLETLSYPFPLSPKQLTNDIKRILEIHGVQVLLESSLNKKREE